MALAAHVATRRHRRRRLDQLAAGDAAVRLLETVTLALGRAELGARRDGSPRATKHRSVGTAFAYRFADVFNGHTFWEFLQQLVTRFAPRKVFLVIDNGPCHWLDDDGKAWLARNKGKIELHRLPPYSPEFNPVEGIWKTTRRRTTHNRFYATTAERDAALRATFKTFQRRPQLIANHLARFK